MNKQQIIDKLSAKLSSQNTSYPKWELNKIIEPFLEVILDELKQDESISIANFGKFTVKVTKGRRFYNIQKNKTEFAPDKRTIVFKPHRSFYSSPLRE